MKFKIISFNAKQSLKFVNMFQTSEWQRWHRKKETNKKYLSNGRKNNYLLFIIVFISEGAKCVRPDQLYKVIFLPLFFLVPFFHISFFVCLLLPSILHISVSLAWVSLYKKHVYHNEGEKVSPYKTSKESKKLPCGSLISVKEHFLW